MTNELQSHYQFMGQPSVHTGNDYHLSSDAFATSDSNTSVYDTTKQWHEYTEYCNTNCIDQHNTESGDVTYQADNHTDYQGQYEGYIYTESDPGHSSYNVPATDTSQYIDYYNQQSYTGDANYSARYESDQTHNLFNYGAERYAAHDTGTDYDPGVPHTSQQWYLTSLSIRMNIKTSIMPTKHTWLIMKLALQNLDTTAVLPIYGINAEQENNTIHYTVPLDTQVLSLINMITAIVIISRSKQGEAPLLTRTCYDYLLKPN